MSSNIGNAFCFPTTSSDEDRLRAMVASARGFTNMAAGERNRKSQEVRDIRTLRRLNESRLRRWRRGEWSFPPRN